MQVNNFFEQEKNGPTQAKLEEALAEFMEAVGDAVDGMNKRAAAAKEGKTS